MQICSLLVRTQPQYVQPVLCELEKVPGAQIHGFTQDTGCLVVTLEDGPDYAVSDSLLALRNVKHVADVSLAFEYTDETPETQFVEGQK